MNKPPRAPRTSFVPRIVLRTLYAGVVPAAASVALGGCGVALAMIAFDATPGQDGADADAADATGR